jgi:trimethylamine-N-oxide reductase cytochrome c-type subunit TorC
LKKFKLIILTLTGFCALSAILLSAVALHPSLSSTKFCLSCHEMNTPHEEYTKSKHFMNPSGVRTECASCHIPQGVGPKLVKKVKALNEIYGHLTGVLDTAEKYEEHRADMAERVWAEMKASDSRECRSCHNQDGFVLAEFKNPKEGERMKKGLAEDQTCIDCHKGIVHKLPDLSGGYKKLYAKLKSSSADPKIKADAVYPLDMVDSYDAKDGKKEGRVIAATRLNILKKKGNWLNVRIDGWRQDGVEGMIYELQGKRIFSVALGKGARSKPITKTTMVDPDTEQTWHQVSYETWVTTSGMVQDLDKLWGYGEKLRTATCGTCHRPSPPGHFLANQWIGAMKDMKRYIKKLDKGQYRFLQKYLQLHARDVLKSAH